MPSSELSANDNSANEASEMSEDDRWVSLCVTGYYLMLSPSPPPLLCECVSVCVRDNPNSIISRFCCTAVCSAKDLAEPAGNTRCVIDFDDYEWETRTIKRATSEPVWNQTFELYVLQIHQCYAPC
jgi:hypothetical protein